MDDVKIGGHKLKIMNYIGTHDRLFDRNRQKIWNGNKYEVMNVMKINK